MITEIRIENFKSIVDLTLQPGRVTVLIGENGSGKSNILEAIAFGAGAAGNKLDREFLYSRGIRVTDYDWMQTAFPSEDGSITRNVDLRFQTNTGPFDYSITPVLRPDNSVANWSVTMPTDQETVTEWLGNQEVGKSVESLTRIIAKSFREQVSKGKISYDDEALTAEIEKIRSSLEYSIAKSRAGKAKHLSAVPLAQSASVADFLIYAPENTVLRAFDPEDAIEPLGSKGQGLLKLLTSFQDSQYRDRFVELKESLRILGWFGDLALPDESDTFRDRVRISDTFLPANKSTFDQRNANEGFLLLLFYFVLFLSWRTPRFFAIDNIDTALNPKLCAILMRQLAALAAKYDKQVIFTTHNPAILDGLDLHDDEQRLFVVHRNDDGHTKVRRVTAPQPQPGERPIKLSEAFLRGLIGGLPKNF